jgi:hypothetical protein
VIGTPFGVGDPFALLDAVRLMDAHAAPVFGVLSGFDLFLAQRLAPRELPAPTRRWRADDPPGWDDRRQLPPDVYAALMQLPPGVA